MLSLPGMGSARHGMAEGRRLRGDDECDRVRSLTGASGGVPPDVHSQRHGPGPLCWCLCFVWAVRAYACGVFCFGMLEIEGLAWYASFQITPSHYHEHGSHEK